MEIIQHYLDWLAQCDCRVALVTDINRSYVEHHGCHQEPWDALYGAKLPPGFGHWFWDIASLSEV